MVQTGLKLERVSQATIQPPPLSSGSPDRALPTNCRSESPSAHWDQKSVIRSICEPSLGHPRGFSRSATQLLQYLELVEQPWKWEKHANPLLLDGIFEGVRLLSGE